MLLIRRDLDVVRADDVLVLVGVIKALGVAEIRYVDGGDVVTGGQGEVRVVTSLIDVGAEDIMLAAGNRKWSGVQGTRWLLTRWQHSP